MAFSFVRSITAALRLNLSSTNKEAKRLTAASEEVFGTSYPLNVCQQAIARAKGMRHWHELKLMEQKLGRDRSLPFWHIHSRNDYHEHLLTALYQAELETSENGPLLFLGAQAQACGPALGLWLEETSACRVPGLILVDTKSPALQDTVLWEPVSSMGLQDMFMQFRSIDTREMNMPVAIGTKPRDWTDALMNALPQEIADDLVDSAVSETLTSAMKSILARNQYQDEETHECYFDSLKKAYYMVSTPETVIPGYSPHLPKENRDSLLDDIEACIERRSSNSMKKLDELMRSLMQKSFITGTVIWQESAYRPAVILFDSDNPETLVLAAVIHSMYYWRYVGHALRYRGIKTRPVLYFSDKTTKAIPNFLTKSSASRNYWVSGLETSDVDQLEEFQKSKAMLVRCESDSFVYCGKRAAWRTAA